MGEDIDLHLEADRLFGPCNDPDCPGAIAARDAEAKARRRQLRLLRGGQSERDVGRGPVGP